MIEGCPNHWYRMPDERLQLPLRYDAGFAVVLIAYGTVSCCRQRVADPHFVSRLTVSILLDRASALVVVAVAEVGDGVDDRLYAAEDRFGRRVLRPGCKQI